MKNGKKVIKKTRTGPTVLDSLPKDRGEWLELVIKLTKRAGLTHQEVKLTDELEKWRKNEGKNQKITP